MKVAKTDDILLYEISKSDYDAFEEIYEAYWDKLFAYVYNKTHSKEISEEIVQDVFISVWDNRHTLQVTTSLSAYLFTAVKYQFLNHIKASKVRQHYAEHFKAFTERLYDNSNEEMVALSDLQTKLQAGIAQLPEKCRQVFLLKKEEKRSTKEIASQLNISQKTVENHMTRALRLLRISLSEFFLFILMILCF